MFSNFTAMLNILWYNRKFWVVCVSPLNSFLQNSNTKQLNQELGMKNVTVLIKAWTIVISKSWIASVNKRKKWRKIDSTWDLIDDFCSTRTIVEKKPQKFLAIVQTKRILLLRIIDWIIVLEYFRDFSFKTIWRWRWRRTL